jgi:putative transposase
MAVEGARTPRKSFRSLRSVEHFLVFSALRAGQIVVMDNLVGAHQSIRGGKGVDREGKGCRVMYLEPYSAELNPIEEAFSKAKHILREISARLPRALIEAMGRALGAVSTKT